MPPNLLQCGLVIIRKLPDIISKKTRKYYKKPLFAFEGFFGAISKLDGAIF